MFGFGMTFLIGYIKRVARAFFNGCLKYKRELLWTLKMNTTLFTYSESDAAKATCSFDIFC